MNILYLLIISYIIGSIPTAYILLKKFHNLDITKEGSGNVGTLNSFEVTNSKKTGIFVLTVDLLKGIVSVILAKHFYPNDFLIIIGSLNFAVLGHCYSPWLKFKGGRGLATAAGGALFVSPTILIIWIASWYLLKKIAKDIHIANFGATIMVILAVILFTDTLNKLTFPNAEKGLFFIFSISLMMLIILSKHIKPLRDLVTKK